MIKSMTGYGHYEKVTKEYKITVEIKSVNHRYCDMSIRLPKKFNAFENKVREILKQFASRGKIDVYINFDDYINGDAKVTYHETIAEDYVRAVKLAGEQFGLETGLNAAAVLRFPEVITLEEAGTDADSFYTVLEEAVRGAGQQFFDAREAEGKHLYEDILHKLDYILELVTFVEQRSPEILTEYRQKISDKVAEFLGDDKIDEGVLATELIVYADKVCVDEETVRLRSHIQNMKNTLQKDEAIGRKLDFIAQEMNREANTILSKANDKELSENAIELKTEIEKIREQIQNIE